MTESHVVTCMLRHESAVLLLRRSAAVGSYAHRWGGVAGYAEGDPDRAAWREIEEETGLEEAVTPVRRGEQFTVEDTDLKTRWIVHPYLFDCAHRRVRLNEETTEAAWVSPPELLRRPTVPELWTSYDRVAPTVATIEADAEHGASYLSLRALEVLRDAAARLQHDLSNEYTSINDLARALVACRPAMAVIANRVRRTLDAAGPDATPPDFEKQAVATLGRAYRDDAEVVERAAGYLAGRRVLTLSRSGTVLAAFLQANPGPDHVYVAVSEPGGEGVGVAECLSRAGLDVTLLPDAAVVQTILSHPVDLVLVGADTVQPNGQLVNKVGTYAAALAARQRQLPCYAATVTDKVSIDPVGDLEAADRASVYDGDALLDVVAPRFEAVPPRLFSGLITEFGLLGMDEVGDIASELRGLASWM